VPLRLFGPGQNARLAYVARAAGPSKSDPEMRSDAPPAEKPGSGRVLKRAELKMIRGRTKVSVRHTANATNRPTSK
jgi:hypothetical protein